MQTLARRYFGATLCAVLLVLCTFSALPFAESGANDDFAYMWSAKTLADTGHIVYCGWSSAMLGWQLALGASFFKLFGFSFTVARLSILCVGLCTAFLLQRLFVRFDLTERNSVFATLIIVLSPLFIPLSFSFMTDIPALFTIVLSWYACLRAVQESERRRSLAWLIFAALSSTILGTARQTGWVGVIVVVPSACWLIRRRRLPVVPLLFLWAACGAFILTSLQWFSRQLYVTRESAPKLGTDHMIDSELAILRIFLGLALFLLPASIAFVHALGNYAKRTDIYCIAFFTLVLAGLLFLRPNSYSSEILLTPSVSSPGSYVTPHGILEIPDTGMRPIVLSRRVRTLLTLVVFCSSFAFLVFLRRVRHLRSSPRTL